MASANMISIFIYIALLFKCSVVATYGDGSKFSISVASQVEICAILKWFMRKLEIFGSFKFAHAILKLCIAFKPLFSHSYL